MSSQEYDTSVEPQQDEVGEVDFESTNGSILDQIRQKRTEVQRPHHLELEIPGYDGLLVAQYEVVNFKVFEDSERRVKKDRSGPKLLLLAMDQLINCCTQILVRDPGHPSCIYDDDGELTEYRPIDVEAAQNGVPVKWEPRLAKLLNIPEDEHRNQARLVVRAVFSNEPALVQHSTKVGLWLKDTSKDIDDVFLGE